MTIYGADVFQFHPSLESLQQRRECPLPKSKYSNQFRKSEVMLSNLFQIYSALRQFKISNEQNTLRFFESISGALSVKMTEKEIKKMPVQEWVMLKRETTLKME